MPPHAGLATARGSDGVQVPTWLVLGEVVAVHIDTALLKDGVYDTASAGHILRAGGPGRLLHRGAGAVVQDAPAALNAQRMATSQIDR